MNTNEYMREYRAKNKDKINKQNRERYKELCEDPDQKQRLKKMGNKRNKKYYNNNKEEIKTRSKERRDELCEDPGQKQRLKEMNDIVQDRYRRNHRIENILSTRKTFAKKNNLPFNITKEWYEEKFEIGCMMTGLPFDELGSDSPWVPHIDRIIPDKGYEINNCRLVCASFNLAKKHWIDEDVIIMAKALIDKQETL